MFRNIIYILFVAIIFTVFCFPKQTYNVTQEYVKPQIKKVVSLVVNKVQTYRHQSR